MKTGVLVFVDKTASVDFRNSEIGKKYEKALKELVEENMSYEGDEFTMYYLHENTSKGRCMQWSVKSAMEDLQGLNVTDIEAAKTSFELSVKKEHKTLMKRALERMYRSNDGLSNRETAILASVPVIAEKAMAFKRFKVYFFSDMMESTARTRDFHSIAPNSQKAGMNWALEDVQAFSDLDLSNVEVNILLPYDATSSSAINNPNVGIYWQTLFENLGASVEEI